MGVLFMKNGKLFVKVVAIVAAIVIVLSAAETVFIAGQTISRIKKANTGSYINTAAIYSDIVTKTLEEYFARLDFYLNADVVKTEDTAQIVSWLRSHESERADELDYVAWVDADANFFSDVGSKTSVPDRDYFQAIMNNGQNVYIDNPVTSKTTGKTIIHICKAAKVNGRTVGFFCGVVDIHRLIVLLDDVDLGGAGVAALFSGNGTLIASKGDNSALGTVDGNGSVNIYGEINDYIQMCSNNNTRGNEWKKIKGKGEELLIMEPIDLTKWSFGMVLDGAHVYGLGTLLRNWISFFSAALVLAIIVIISICLIISLRPLGIVEHSILDIATGNADLTKRIDIHSNDEIGRVVDGFNQFSAKLQNIMSAMKDTKQELVDSGETLRCSTEDTAAAIKQIIENIKNMGNNINAQTDSVHETAGAVNEIASNIESLNRMIESQSSAVTQASASVEEMIGNINSVNSSVQKMASEFEDLERKSLIGVQRQDEVNDKVQVIESESQALKEANAVISNIAEQTNLLAMNAAIEAAHAGEAGKGFSVVADEIRKLSETSSSQSKTIGDQLNRITESIDDIVSKSKQAKDAFADVTNGIKATNNLVQEIRNSMLEQGEGSKQISIALNNMNDTTQQVRTSSFEMSEGNKAILEEIKILQDSSYNMKSGMDEMAAGATRINETGTALSTLAEEMETSIAKIGEQVDQFKV